MTKRSWREWIYGGPNKDGKFKNTSFVYVLRAPNNLCKIGHSSEPIWRVRRLREDSDVALELICLVRHPRAADLELALQQHFRELGRKPGTVDECLEEGILVRSIRFDQQWQQYEWFWLIEADVTWLHSKTTEEVDAC